MAALDTLDNEPVKPDHPLLHAPEAVAGKLLFSPHIAGITASSFRRSYAMIAQDIRDAAEGRIPKRVVNPW
jgi:phosphoglycerate dehydrogenase-like enzyme